MGSVAFKRRRIVVDRDFQFRYLMTWIGLTMALLGGLVLASVTTIWVVGANLSSWLLWVNGACALVITVISLYYIILHSHRIAGPAFRLERLIRDIAKGRRGFRVRLRRKDYLKHIASALNELLDQLEAKEARIHELGLRIGELSDDDREDDGDEARTVSRELADLCAVVDEIQEDGAEAEVRA